MQKLRSSFFYFFFPIIGGTFASVALCFYYSHLLKTRTKYFAILALILGLLVHITVFNSIAQILPAPFYLRDFLNQTRGATASSLLGLGIALIHLLLMRQRDNVDALVFIEKEWPTIPNLVCCLFGGLINIGLVSVIYWLYN